MNPLRPEARLARLTCTLATILATASCGGSPPAPATTSVAPRPCGAAAQLLAKLKMPQIVDFYVTPGLAPVDAAAARLERLLGDYQAASEGKLVFHVVPVRTEDDAARAKELGLVSQPNPDGAGGASHGYYFGLVFREGTEKRVLALLSVEQTRWLDFWLTGKMREVRDAAEGLTQRIGVLVGHGELSPSAPNLMPSREATQRGPSVETVISQSFTSYRFVDVDLKGGAAPVDDSLAGLLATQPTGDLTDAELRAIDRFVMKGKPLAVFASAANVRAGDPKMRVTLGAHGLERLLAGYGIELRRDLVLDPGAPEALKGQGLLGAVDLAFPQIPRVAPLASSPFFAGVDELALPFASSLVIASSDFLASPFALAFAAPPASRDPAWRPSADQMILENVGPMYARETLTKMVLTFKNILDWMSDGGTSMSCVP